MGHNRMIAKLATAMRRVGGPVFLGVLLFLVPARPAERRKSFDMNQFLRRAFLTREFQSKQFGPVRWMSAGEAYSTVEPSKVFANSQDLVRYDTATGNRNVIVSATELIPAGATKPLSIEGYDWSADDAQLLIYTNSRRVWRANTRGDYWLFNLREKTLKKLGGDAAASTLQFAKFSPDGQRVAYVRENNIYVEQNPAGIIRLTTDGSANIINGTSDWVYEEEFFLRDAFRWSPDGQRIAYWQFNSGAVEKFALVYNTGAPYTVVTHIPYPQYGLYPIVKEIPYPQPGMANSSVRIGVAAASGGATTWLRVPGDPSDNYIGQMEWAGDSKFLSIQHLNRLQNTNDIILADTNTGSTEQIYHDHDSAWLDVVNDFQWLHGGKEFLWVSEGSGWRHVQVISRDGKHTRLITPGNFDVIAIVGVSRKEDWLYYMASPENATQKYLYRARLDGKGACEKLSPDNEPGTRWYQPTPDFRWALHTYSRFDSPPITNLVDLSERRVARTLEDNAALRENLKSVLSQPTDFIRVNIGQGVSLDAWMMKPADFNPSKKYPVLVFVYGEPAGQTVMDSWEGDISLFHRALAQAGYLIFSVDNRGTPAPRGRDWRKAVYGKVGVLSSEEQAKTLKILEAKYSYLDSSRVAVWGWSGGGSNTLNLMFRFPDLYKVGMSVAPVADQRLYDTIYQERYMGTPQTNPDGYKAGSPINFAEGLTGNLLIVHSPADDNVHFQGTELLINRLVELGKPFDFMEYPGRTHGLSEGPGTLFHLYSLLARYLEEHIKAGPAVER